MSSLLAQVDQQVIYDVADSAFSSAKDIINIVLPIILGVVLLVGTIYAIILGVNYSKAEDAEERKKAKDRLVGAIVGFLITLVIIAVIYAVLSFFLPDKRKPQQLTDAQFKNEITVKEEGGKYYLTIGGQAFETEIKEDTDLTKLAESKTMNFRGGNLKVTSPTSLKAKLKNGKITVTMTAGSGNDAFTVTAVVDVPVVAVEQENFQLSTHLA